MREAMLAFLRDSEEESVLPRLRLARADADGEDDAGASGQRDKALADAHR